LEGLVEILGFGGWQRTAAHDHTRQRTEATEPAKAATGVGAIHGLG
jgi:hypothetical protein